ncbi:MAG: serine/threonine-protein kinase [Sandaracinaceae bacterium]
MAASAERRELRDAVLDRRYRLGCALGIGGTSVVFEAERLSDGTPVVVKVLRDAYVHNAELARRLRREGEVARRVVHPGIVPALDEGQLEDGSPYLVLERLEGECIARFLRRNGPMKAQHVGVVAFRAAAILHAVHVAGYVHRDIKPEHIVLAKTPDGRLDVRLLDFGVCASATSSEEEREAERGRVYGTPAYVSPEQAAGVPDVDGRADVFSLGIAMFEMLTGRAPFVGSNVANLLRRIIREDAPRVGLMLPDLDLRYDALVARAMARRIDDRFPSARSLARASLPLLGDRREVERELADRVKHRPPKAELIETRPDPSQRAVA